MDKILAPIKQRIIQYIEYKNFEKKSFYALHALSASNFRGKSLESEVGGDVIAKISTSYSEINLEWLLTGKGKMLKEKREDIDAEIKQIDEIPLIPIEAMADFGREEQQIAEYDNSNGYKIPELEGKGVKYFIRVSGSSMYPKYSNGDLLACKPLHDLSFFQWGKTYVLDTEQGAVVKRLFPCTDNEEYLECHSDNKDHYPPFKIPKTSVKAVSIVVGVITLE